MPSRIPITAVLVLALAAGPLACVGPGLLTDGSSVSIGLHGRNGALRNGRRLPFSGEGYRMPQRWRERKRNWAIDELVGLLRRAARLVRRQHRGSLLGIADLSERGGGPALPEHLSHQNGRDVDLLFYAVDLKGRPLAPTAMIRFDKTGASVPPKEKSTKASGQPNAALASATSTAATPSGAPVKQQASASMPTQPPPYQPSRFDLKRNWALIRALLTDPEAQVQWIFIGRPLIKLLLKHARKTKQPKWLIERAAEVMHQPGDASPHTDHLHVRVFCPISDRRLGCTDRGPPRWLKKSIKYADEPPTRIIPAPLRRMFVSRLHLPLLLR